MIFGYGPHIVCLGPQQTLEANLAPTGFQGRTGPTYFFCTKTPFLEAIVVFLKNSQFCQLMKYCSLKLGETQLMGRVGTRFQKFG